MRCLLILSLVLTACGGSKSSNPLGAIITQPGSTPTPTPIPNHFVGVWKGQDYSPTFQDLVTLNSDFTGTELACNWSFVYRVDPSSPTDTLDMYFTAFPVSPNAGCRDVSMYSGCTVMGQPGFVIGCYLTVTYVWSTPYNQLFLEQLLGTGIANTYNLQ